MTEMFAESNADRFSGGDICRGCWLPTTSCICSTPWSELEFDEPEFVLADEWEPELCRSPEYHLLLNDPPPFYRKRDRDQWRHSLKGLTQHGVMLWD